MTDQLIFKCNEEINYNPLVLGFSFFKVIKEESNIKGYWKDEAGKLYIDNIEKISIPIIRKELLLYYVKEAFRLGEKAVFYKNRFNEAVIQSKEGTQILRYQRHIVENKKPNNEYIKELLNDYNGLTVYRLDDNNYLIEIYK